jgi:hypothetical protein
MTENVQINLPALITFARTLVIFLMIPVVIKLCVQYPLTGLFVNVPRAGQEILTQNALHVGFVFTFCIFLTTAH